MDQLIECSYCFEAGLNYTHTMETIEERQNWHIMIKEKSQNWFKGIKRIFMGCKSTVMEYKCRPKGKISTCTGVMIYCTTYTFFSPSLPQWRCKGVFGRQNISIWLYAQYLFEWIFINVWGVHTSWTRGVHNKCSVRSFLDTDSARLLNFTRGMNWHCSTNHSLICCFDV